MGMGIGGAFWGRVNEIKMQNDALREQEKQAKAAQKEQERRAQVEMWTKQQEIAEQNGNAELSDYAMDQIISLNGYDKDDSAPRQALQEMEYQQRQGGGQEQSQPQPPAITQAPPQPTIDPNMAASMANASTRPGSGGEAPVESTAIQEGVMAPPEQPALQQGPPPVYEPEAGPMVEQAVAPEQPMVEEPIVEEPVNEFIPTVEAELSRGQGITAPPTASSPRSPRVGANGVPRHLTAKEKAVQTAEAEVASKNITVPAEYQRERDEKIKELQSMPQYQDALAAAGLADSPEAAVQLLNQGLFEQVKSTYESEWKDTGDQLVLVDSLGNQYGSISKTATPGEQLTYQLGMRRDATKRLELQQIATAKKAESGGKTLTSERLKVLDAAYTALGGDTKAFKDIAKGDYQSYLSHVSKQPDGEFLIESDVESLRSMDKAQANLRYQTRIVLNNHGIEGSIEDYAASEGINLSVARGTLEDLATDTDFLGKLENALLGADAALQGQVVKLLKVDPEAFAIESNVMAMAPAIAKALGHVGNLNESEVAAAASIVSGISTPPKVAAALFLMVDGNIQAQKDMVHNRARFNPAKPKWTPEEIQEALDAGYTQAQIDALR